MTGFSVKIVRTVLRSGIRGRVRFALFLAHRLKSLQAVPVRMPDGATLYADLRVGSAHRLLTGAPVEADEQAVMRRAVMEGDVAFDIGAHIGVHTVLLSSLVGPRGKVCAFEPNLEILPALRRTAEALVNTSIYPLALSNQSGRSILFVPADQSMASLTDWTRGRGSEAHEVTCETYRLDELVESGSLPTPDFIKCDVEGAELLVFQGGRKTLDRPDAPIILFEANSDAARGFGLGVQSSMNFLAGLCHPRYRFFEVREGGTLLPVESLSAHHSNVLAVPDSKAQRFA